LRIALRPLTAEAFSPYGDVLTTPAEAGRSYFEQGLGNGRAAARPSLSMINRTAFATLPVEAKLMERHEFSSQTFVPLEAGRWLVLVCPHASGGGPDMARADAFIAGPHQGVTYRMNIWHHGLTVLDRPARFAVFMWRDGTKGDEEFVPVTPATVS